MKKKSEFKSTELLIWLLGDWRRALERGSQETDFLLQTLTKRQQNREFEMNRFLWQQHSKRLPPVPWGSSSRIVPRPWVRNPISVVHTRFVATEEIKFWQKFRRPRTPERENLRFQRLASRMASNFLRTHISYVVTDFLPGCDCSEGYLCSHVHVRPWWGLTLYVAAVSVALTLYIHVIQRAGIAITHYNPTREVLGSNLLLDTWHA
jgi:hypothetical protein